MAKNKHRSGGKFDGSHTTVIKAALPVVDAAADHDSVKKIVLGLIESKRKGAGSPLRVKCIPLSDGIVGFEVVIAKGGAKQRVYIYVTSETALTEVKRLLESFTDKKAGQRGKNVRGSRKDYHRTIPAFDGEPEPEPWEGDLDF